MEVKAAVVNQIEAVLSAMSNSLSEQRSSTGSRQQTAAIQRESQKEEGKEGEKAPEERG